MSAFAGVIAMACLAAALAGAWIVSASATRAAAHLGAGVALAMTAAALAALNAPGAGLAWIAFGVGLAPPLLMRAFPHEAAVAPAVWSRMALIGAGLCLACAGFGVTAALLTPHAPRIELPAPSAAHWIPLAALAAVLAGAAARLREDAPA